MKTEPQKRQVLFYHLLIAIPWDPPSPMMSPFGNSLQVATMDGACHGQHRGAVTKRATTLKFGELNKVDKVVPVELKNVTEVVVHDGLTISLVTLVLPACLLAVLPLIRLGQLDINLLSWVTVARVLPCCNTRRESIWCICAFGPVASRHGSHGRFGCHRAYWRTV